MRIRSNLGVAGACAVVLALTPAVWAAAPHGVSPGGVDRETTTEDRSPTFSWGAVASVSDYDLVVLALPEGLPVSQVDMAKAEEVLFTTVPGSATSWTPSAEQSLDRGGRYVWFVRGVTFAGDGEVLDATEWSLGRYFTITTAPSVDEVEAALDVLRRYSAGSGRGAATAAGLVSQHESAAGDAARVDAPGEGPKSSPRSVLTSAAAIRGTQTKTEDEAYGVVGVSGSPFGAGIGVPTPWVALTWCLTEALPVRLTQF